MIAEGLRRRLAWKALEAARALEDRGAPMPGSLALRVAGLEAFLTTKHLGPGPHPSGSPQSVHGKQREGAASSNRLEKMRSLIAEYDPRIRELERLQAEDDQKINAASDPTNAAFMESIADPQNESLLRRVDELDTVLQKAVDEALAHNREKNALHTELIVKMRDALRSDDPYQQRLDFASAVESTRPGGTAALDIVDGWIDRGVLPEADYVVEVGLTENWRAHFDGSIRVNPQNAGPNVFVHEYGHWLENYIPYAQQRAREFRDRRTSDEELVLLSSFDKEYAPSEKTRPDKFYSPYVGKEYDSGDTEVVSMGLEALYRNPYEFYRADQEHFEFMIGLLQRGGG